jgi:hypothetical protein
MLLQVSLALLAPFLTCQTFHGELVCHFPLVDILVVQAAPVLQGTKHFRLLVVPVVVAPDPKPPSPPLTPDSKILQSRRPHY